MKKHAVFALIGFISFVASFAYQAYNSNASDFISNCLFFVGIILMALAYKIFNNISILGLMRSKAVGNQEIIKKDTTRTLHDGDFEIARDCLAKYQEALLEVLNVLKNNHNTSPQEMETYSRELAKVSGELNSISPDDDRLINRAKFIYSRQAQDLIDRLNPR